MTSTGLFGKGLTRIATSVRIAPVAFLLGAWLLAAGVFAVGASSAQAPARSASGTIDGVVTDTSLAPLADATAWILGSDIRVATGANGRFRMVGLPPGEYILIVRRLGYAVSSTVARVTERDTLRASFMLERVATELDPIVVAASHAPTRMAEFEHRRKLGEGQFMTQTEIEKRNEPLTSDLLRTFMSVAVAGTAFNRRMLPTRSCPFQFFVDGVAIPTPKIDVELPSPKELAGIEVYANSATIPLQYKTFGGNSGFNSGGGFCGVILIWTRIGS